jgi:hypothetical protein
MDDSSLFLQWAVNMLHHRDPGVLADDRGEDAAFPSLQALREASQGAAVVLESTEPAESTESSGDGGAIGCIGSMSPNSGRTSVPRSTGSALPMNWNFGAVSARPSSGGDVTPAVATTIPEMVYGSQPTRRPFARSTTGPGPVSAVYAQGHIMAERKRRENINQRFIELSAVIPGLKKVN